MPPKGTAGLARSAVSGSSRLPSPPASTIAKTLGEPVRLAMDCSLLPGRPRAYARRRTSVHEMRVDILSKEYPPQVYGGAGAQRSDELSDVDARATVDMERILLAQDVNSHFVNASPAAGVGARTTRQ